jgi:hypothetical protein
MVQIDEYKPIGIGEGVSGLLEAYPVFVLIETVLRFIPFE